MLHFISWARFGAFIIVILVIYYGYVLLRFYGRELRALVGVGKGRREGITEDEAAPKKDKDAVGVGKGDGVQGGLAPLFPESGVRETPEMFKVMEKVIFLLRQAVSEAAATGVRREELEDRIRMVLSGYRQLVKTPYQVSINNFIQRSCTTTFSLLLSDKEIAELWGGKDRISPHGAVLVAALLVTMSVVGQTVDGNAGINQANTMVRTYFDTAINLLYAVGGLLGLIGGARVYSKWSHHDPDTGKAAAAWFGACVFLVVVATVIKSFFGLT